MEMQPRFRIVAEIDDGANGTERGETLAIFEAIVR
jgi:hypothetical protein